MGHIVNNKNISNTGITLVELIIALAILNIVLAVAYNFFSFGNTSFVKGSDQSNVQRDIRLVSHFVTSEVRNATKLELYSTPPSNPELDTEPGYNYIIIKDNTITHIENGTSNNKVSCEIKDENTYFELEKLDNDENIVHFFIAGQEGNQEYELSSGVFLNNLNKLPATTEPQVAIRYIKP